MGDKGKQVSYKSHSPAVMEDRRQEREGAVADISQEVSINDAVMELVPSSLASLREISFGAGAIFGNGNVVLNSCVININVLGNRSALGSPVAAALQPEREPQSVDQENWYFTPFAALKLTLCEKLEKADIVKLVQHFDLESFVADARNLSPLKFFKILERKNLVSDSEVDRLLEGLFAIENEPLVAVIAEYKKRYVAVTESENESVSMTLDDTQRIPAISSRETEVNPDLPTDDHKKTAGFKSEDSACTPSRPTIRFPIDGDHNLLCVIKLIVLPKEEENNPARSTCGELVKYLKDIVWAASGCLDHLTNVFFCLLNSYGPLIEISDTADGIKFHLDVNSLPHLESLQEDVEDESLAKELMQLLLAEELEKWQEHQRYVSTRLESDTVQKQHSFLIAQRNKQLTVEGLQGCEFFCDYCKVFFDEDWQHDFHINSDDHQKNIASRQGNEAWTERDPPLKITNGNFKYCANVVDKSCEYTGKKGTENKCLFAHTASEFEEWKQRHQQRLKVIQRISDQTESMSSTRGGKKGRRKKSKWVEVTSKISEKIAAKANTIKSVGSIKYSKEDKIAKGSVGSIFLGKFGGRDVAVKKIENDDVQKEPDLFKKMELEALNNVLKILYIEKDEDFTYIVTALCEYDLKTVIESENNPIKDHLTSEKRIQLCVDILRGLSDLHLMHIIHRDLKPNNILLDVNGQAFVADFGISRNVTGVTTHVTSCYGSLCWLACESVSTSKDDKVKCKKESDVQVAGFLIYYVLSDGHHPFEASFPFSEKPLDLMSNLSKGEFCLSHLQDFHYPSKCTSLLTSMLDQDMSKRPTMDQCLKDMQDIHRLCVESAKNNVLTLDEVTFNMPDVKVVCKPNCIKYLPGANQKKKHKLTWTLHVTCTTNKLVKIYLWRNQSDTFSLSRGVGQLRQQELDVRDIQKESSGSFGIFVNFESKKRGAFHQWLVFDFGSKPVLCHQFLVWVGPNFAKYFQTDDDSMLWDLSNHEVVRYSSDFNPDPDPLYEKLEADYPLLEETSDEFSTPEQLTADNFQEYFHDMVYDEERAYIKRLKQFNGHQEVYLKQRIDDKKFKVKPLSGQLFGEIKWKVPLDDSEASQIVTKSVKLALLKFESAPEVIYEAEIVARRRLDLREVDHFIVSLSPKCVTDQDLKSDVKVPVNVQFKVDRKIFCFYHYAIDNLKTKELLFPPRDMFPRFLEEQTTLDEERVEEQSDFSLNHRQEETRKFLSGAREAVPFRQGPSLIIGPFGTGKTSTLARTVVDILELDRSSKLLICTHSNSAADLFFKKFLDAPQNLEGCFFRIYATERDPATVDEKIKGYCNFDPMSNRFTKPFADLEEMSGHRVVITTLANSIHLVDIPELRGHFTHIFIDEAGQALETEAMIPLGLAEPRTVVVLAGDHKQMRPKVYSKKAKKCSFQRSMLERLFYWSKNNNCNNFHFLTENYRMLSPEILSFIGEHCYHVKNFAIARSKDQQRASSSSSHPSMVFSAISGEDKLEKISYFNEKEVTEILQQILELKKNWPSEWKDLTDKSIAVLTPYKSQVQLLRESLKERCPVNISTVQNSQGEQFEVVFISTVRTRHTIAKDDMPSPSLTRSDPDYYGVLSDEGELTTALTRARSLLWVVGDPISLCSVGKCQKIWKEYIQNCEELNSLKPSDTSWPAIKEKLAALTADAPAEEDEGTSEIAASFISTTEAAEEVELLQSSVSQDSDTDAELEEVDDDTYDELMQMWEKEVKKDFPHSDQSAVGQEEPSNGAPVQQSLAQPQPSSRRKRKYKPAYGMQHGDADKVIWVKLETNYDYSKLKGAYDEEVEEGPEELDDAKRAQNIQLAKNDPENYCIAVLQFAENHLVHAIPLESHSHDKIVISSKRNRKNALDGDQVVLHKWKKRDVMYGEVTCVLNRAEDLKWKKIVCALDPENVDLMCPVDNDFLPKMYIYPKGAQTTEHGDVTFGLYHISQHKERRIREKSVTVKSTEMTHKLFVVRYFRWGDNFAYPLGIVTEELPPCDSLENGLKVLRMKHGVREKWPESVKEEIKQHLYHEKWEIPKTELNARKENDLRSRSVFTIGKSDLSDRDSAIHVEKLQNGKVKLGFHLADVPFFVEKGSCMDAEAFRRGCSFFDIRNKPSHMLPDVLSTNLCIFKENSERLSVSFVLTLSLDECLIVENVEMYRSVVSCKQNLTFERVEAYLLNKYDPSFEFHREVMQQIELLYKVMRHLSQVPQLHSEAKIEDQVNFPLAYALVEGIRKLVNVEVSKILNGLSQHNIPVCLQLHPKEPELIQWYQKFEEDAHQIPHLPTVALCDRKRTTYEKPIPVLQSAWEEVGRILSCGKDKILEMKKLLGCSEVFPKQVATLANLSDIIPHEEYTFTSTGNGEICFPHFSLQEDCDRVHPFMSPVRSFMDLMVLRMLVASLQNAGNPYSNDDLTDITYHCTKQTQSAQNYKKRAQVLELAFSAKVVPQHLQAVIHSASEDELTLAYPFKGFLEVIKSLTGVPLRLLKPAERPVDGDIQGKSVELNWKNRIYNYNGKMIDLEDNKHDLSEEEDAQGNLWLITDGHIKYIPFSYWDKMMQSVDQEKYECLKDLENGWEQANTSRSQTKGKIFVNDVTCEKRLTSQCSTEVKKYVKFFRKFNPGDVVDLQLCSDMQQGALTPEVQLLKMTAMYDLCLEHRNMPVECFTEMAERMPPVCRTVEKYVEAWLPMLKMMVAYNTIVSDETIVIHNVSIRWSKEFLGSSREIYGHFSLEKKWCDDRQILFSPLPRGGGSPRGLLDETRKFLVSDYICVRFNGQGRKDKHISQSQKTGLQQEVSVHKAPVIVVHGVAGVTNVGRPAEEDNYDVMFQVTQTSCDILKCVFDESGGRDTVCSVELIPKSESEKRMEGALMDLENSSTLTCNIILQNPDGIEKSVEGAVQQLLDKGSKINHKSVKRLFPQQTPNQFQSHALRRALSQPFTVIQGPPGTGKTRTGAYLTAFFAKLNKENKKLFQESGDKPPQILYCGPSNKSVDVIAQFLQKLSKTVKLSFVRVYGDSIEQQIFPVPGVEGAERKFTYFEDRHMPEEVKKNALHHLIRSEEAGVDGKAIKDMDRKFKEGKLEPSLNAVRHYKDVVKRTKIKILKSRDIILCTCNAAGHFILKGNLNIVQCIIDEAGMCFELDNLIPLVCQRPKQVVLIGDHKQLRPIIQHPRAKQLGAEISLMEKYKESAYTIRTQYRMHEEICRFPSEEFYDGSLITDQSVKDRKDFLPKEIWPGKGQHPRVFCHIVGEEYAQTVLTSDGGELSKSNEKEACEVVRIVRYLLEKLKVDRENLVVLSQYKLQCSLLREKLRGLRVSVHTIIKSQGSEWDFVLLSTVRSLPDDEIPERPGRSWRRKYLGYIEDENQMNVGITRARQGLIIVGNKYLLATCSKWKKLIQHYEKTGSVVDAENFLKQPRN